MNVLFYILNSTFINKVCHVFLKKKKKKAARRNVYCEF